MNGRLFWLARARCSDATAVALRTLAIASWPHPRPPREMLSPRVESLRPHASWLYPRPYRGSRKFCVSRSSWDAIGTGRCQECGLSCRTPGRQFLEQGRNGRPCSAPRGADALPGVYAPVLRERWTYFLMVRPLQGAALQRGGAGWCSSTLGASPTRCMALLIRVGSRWRHPCCGGCPLPQTLCRARQHAGRLPTQWVPTYSEALCLRFLRALVGTISGWLRMR